jgi:CRP-like cAMP-binding protein
MRRQDIADFLGLKLETVSRPLAKLEQKNVIRV